MTQYHGTAISQGMLAAEARKEAAVDRGQVRELNAGKIAEQRMRLKDLEDSFKVTPAERRAKLKEQRAIADKAITERDLALETYDATVTEANATADAAEIEAKNAQAVTDAAIRKENAIAQKETMLGDYYGAQAESERRPDKEGVTEYTPTERRFHLKQADTLVGRAQTARVTREAAQYGLALLQQGLVDSGRMQQFKNYAAGMAAEVGIPLPEWFGDKKLPNNELMVSFYNKLLAQKVEDSPRISDMDLAVLKLATAGIQHTPEANAMNLRYQINQDVLLGERADFINEVVQIEGKSYAEASQRWDSTYGGNFRSTALTAKENKLITYTEFRKSFISKYTEKGLNRPDDVTIASEWKKKYYAKGY